MLHTFGQNCWWKWQTCEWSEPAMPAASCTWRWSVPQNCSLRCSWKCLRIRDWSGSPRPRRTTGCHFIPLPSSSQLSVLLLSWSSVSWDGAGVLFEFSLGVAGGQLYTHGWKYPFNAGTCDSCNLFFSPLMWVLWQLNSENMNRPISFTSICVVTSSHPSLPGK